MDHARNPLIRRLRAADTYGRFRALSPRTSKGTGIIVHSKVGVFDDRVMRVGSANLNNRSEGFDTECDLAIEANNAAARRSIVRLRDVLLSHYLACSPAVFAEARIAEGGLVAAIDRLNRRGRLAQITTGKVTRWEILVARQHLGDPGDVKESWRPRRRDYP